MKRRRTDQHGKPRKPHPKSEPGLKLFRRPLSTAEPAAIRAAFLKMADRKTEQFPALIKTILQGFRERYPPHIIAVMAGYGLTAPVSDAGVSAKRLTPKIEQHHIELLQALMLMLPISEWGEPPASPADIQKIIDSIVDLADAFFARRFKAIEEASDLQARTVLALQERLRMHTQMVRNWGYFSEVVQISSELYAPLDDAFRNAHGFAASDLIATGRHLVRLLEDRNTENFKRLKLAFRERTIPRLVRAFFKHHPEMKEDAEQFLRAIPDDVTLEQVKFRLLAHASISLVVAMSFAAQQVAQSSGLTVDTTGAVLDALSLHPGDLSGQDPERLFMANPVWRSPVLKVGSAYFCPAPQSLFSHIHEVMRSLADKIGLSKSLESRRAAYLEDKVKRLLSEALPTAQFRHGIKWRSDEVEYETDHVAAIDKTVVIIEDKSAALTAPGLRGAPDRVRRHVTDLIVAPSEQSSRLENIIWEAKAGDRNAAATLTPFGLDFAGTERVVRISVTLDDFSILASAEGELKEAGWIPRSLMLASTLNVADFQAAIDILGRPAYFLHYFAERGRLQRALRIFADEMDFLGFYLDTGFNVGDLEKENVSLALTGMSAAVDHYYNSRDAGVVVRKPTPKLSPYFSALISAIESRAFAGWTTVTTDLLRCASWEEQRKAEKILAKLKKQVERDWRDPENECSLVISPPEARDTAVVFYAYPPQHATRRDKIAEELASKAFEMSGRQRCIMICRNTAQWDEPYKSIFIFHAAADQADDVFPLS
ncbi:hypothetical protein [Bradyrhizobium roseum]|uniref:hypothetical protein n=1 Tax=Bradyrhizobium roseum TaxID=3056648 RepID=UPI0026155DF1|nr:hypothetical protein [Bradyrhizobium roseus]WKA29784.1 hypothetical protein QUH67_06295 [Bradyrhizobium roseus]